VVTGKYSHLDQLNLEKVVSEWIDGDSSKPVEERTKVYYQNSSTESKCDILSSVDATGEVN